MVFALFAMIFAIFALRNIAQDPWIDEPKATEISKNRNFLSAFVLGALSAFRLALGQDPKMCNLGIHEWHRGAVGA